jgi:hypothetical protein
VHIAAPEGCRGRKAYYIGTGATATDRPGQTNLGNKNPREDMVVP